MRRRIEIGVPAAAVAAVLVIWTWIGIAAAVGGECRRYETEPLSAQIFESLVVFAAASALVGMLVNVVALADENRRPRAWRGLWVSLGAAGVLVLAVITALVLVVAACVS